MEILFICDLQCAYCNIYVNGEVFNPLEDFVFTPDPTLTEEENDELEEKLQSRTLGY